MSTDPVLQFQNHFENSWTTVGPAPVVANAVRFRVGPEWGAGDTHEIPEGSTNVEIKVVGDLAEAWAVTRMRPVFVGKPDALRALMAPVLAHYGNPVPVDAGEQQPVAEDVPQTSAERRRWVACGDDNQPIPENGVVKVTTIKVRFYDSLLDPRTNMWSLDGYFVCFPHGTGLDFDMVSPLPRAIPASELWPLIEAAARERMGSHYD